MRVYRFDNLLGYDFQRAFNQRLLAVINRLKWLNKSPEQIDKLIRIRIDFVEGSEDSSWFLALDSYRQVSFDWSTVAVIYIYDCKE